MNLEQVAKRAGVSTATVSRTLNNQGLVRPKTRRKVLKAVEELRYFPNLHARTLAGGTSKTIGMIVSNLENPFFFDVYQAVERGAHARGYEVVVANTDYRAENLVSSVRMMIGWRVTGLAMIVSEMDAAVFDELAVRSIPVVFYDVGSQRRNITNIRVNYRRGIEKVMNHLHGLGHRKFGFIGHHPKLGPIHERLRTVLDLVADRAGEVQARAASAESDSLEGGRAATSTLLAGNYRPTAIICANDLMAVGALRELRERGLRVPQDVSVTGFDNIKMSEFCSPPLTTVNIPRDWIGNSICLHLIPSGDPVEQGEAEMVVEPELIIRESTARPNQPPTKPKKETGG